MHSGAHRRPGTESSNSRNEKEKMKNRWQYILSQKNPIRFVFSYGLRKLQIGLPLTFKRSNYELSLASTALTYELFADPSARLEEEKYLASLLAPGESAIDVGANIGTTTLCMSFAVGELGEVHSLEPHPRVFNVLAKNISLNKIKNVKIINAAAGTANRPIAFSDDRSDDINAQVTSPQARDKVITVNSITLDSLTTKLDLVTVLKIDVEGAEISVLQGGANLLKRTKFIQFESFERGYESFGYKLRDIITFLAGYGFQIYRLDYASKSLNAVPETYSSIIAENLFACRDQHRDELLARSSFHISTGQRESQMHT
jgi:FkbM family methyltransferase